MRALISLPAGFAGMPLGAFLMYSALGTVLWTGALAYAGVLLRANFGMVEGWINVVTNVVLAAFGVMIIRRYVKCWRKRRTR